MDLFDQDKRLTLKPVRDFAELLQSVFAAGACTCVKCTVGNGPGPGQAQHTFEIDGHLSSRRFAISAYSDVRGALSKAFESYHKTTLPDRGPVDFEAIAVLVGADALGRLRHLLYASGVVKDLEGVPQFAAEG